MSVHLTFIQHTIHEIVCNMEVTFFNLFDIRISFKDSELHYSKSLNMKQLQTYREVKFSCGMDEMYTYSYMAIPSRL